MTDEDYVVSLLSSGETPIAFRTTTHAAYYHAYRIVMRSAVAAGFVVERNGADHVRLRNFLKSPKIKIAGHRVANRLLDLHGLRKLADYHSDLPFPKAKATEAVDLMAEAIAALPETLSLEIKLPEKPS